MNCYNFFIEEVIEMMVTKLFAGVILIILVSASVTPTSSFAADTNEALIKEANEICISDLIGFRNLLSSTTFILRSVKLEGSHPAGSGRMYAYRATECENSRNNSSSCSGSGMNSMQCFIKLNNGKWWYRTGVTGTVRVE